MCSPFDVDDNKIQVCEGLGLSLQFIRFQSDLSFIDLDEVEGPAEDFDVLSASGPISGAAIQFVRLVDTDGRPIAALGVAYVNRCERLNGVNVLAAISCVQA